MDVFAIFAFVIILCLIVMAVVHVVAAIFWKVVGDDAPYEDKDAILIFVISIGITLLILYKIGGNQ